MRDEYDAGKQHRWCETGRMGQFFYHKQQKDTPQGVNLFAERA